MEVSDKKHNHIILQYIVLLFSEVNIAAVWSFYLDPLTVYLDDLVVLKDNIPLIRRFLKQEKHVTKNKYFCFRGLRCEIQVTASMCAAK